MGGRHRPRAERISVHRWPYRLLRPPPNQRVYPASSDDPSGALAIRPWKSSSQPREAESIRSVRAAHARRCRDPNESRHTHSRSDGPDSGATRQDMVGLRSAWPIALRLARGRHLVAPAAMEPRRIRSLDVFPDVGCDGVFEPADPSAADPGKTESAGVAGPRAPLSSGSGFLIRLCALATAFRATAAGGLRADTSRSGSADSVDRRSA